VLGTVGERLVAIELAHVRQVIPMIFIESCPGGPKALVGFANLAGEPVPVLTVRTLFGLPDAADAVEQVIVVCSHRSRAVGLVVDAVTGLGRPEAARSPTIDDRIVAVEVVKSIGLAGDRLCVVLDHAVAVDWLTRVLEPAAVEEGQ
jgi:purine-binding chemotaxis protein CheW